MSDRFGKVAVLMGGQSAEREISLKSGAAVLAALLAAGVDAHAVDVNQDVVHQLEGQGYARAFNILHGRGGEDGVIQALLEFMHIPYTGSGVLASALCMDKQRTKQLWQGVGLPTPEFRMCRSADELSQVAHALGLPLMFKPSREGSSIGMTKVTDPAQLQQAFDLAVHYDREVMLEQFIEGQEYTAAIIGTETLPLIRLETPRAFYDYAAKYEADDTRYHCPCGLDSATEAQLQALALQAFAAVDGSGWGRVDFMLDGQGEPWLIEVNTIPGMTDHSLVPMAARAAGMDFEQLVVRILETTLV